MADFTYKDIKILYEDNHLLVVEKPCNILMQQDATNDLDLLTLLKHYLKETYNKPGNVYLGLVHRLDRPVGGVCVFAKTSKAASRLSETIRKNQMHKIYTAVVLNEVKRQKDTLIDYLYKDTKTNLVRVVSSTHKEAKKAILHYTVLAYADNLTMVSISLETGRPHQIRVQFSSRNHPLYGDQRYNKKAIVKQQIALWATKLTFEHPTTKEMLTFESDLPNTLPYTNFKGVL